MDLSGLGHLPGLAGRSNVEPLDPQALIAQLGSEVATALSTALERLASMAPAISAAGVVDLETMRLLREDIDRARQAGIRGQQVVRLCSGQLQLSHERLDLTALLRETLRQRGREIESRGIEVKQMFGAALVQGDATLLFSLLQALLDWAFEHAASRIDLTLEVRNWPAHACLGVAFAHLPPDQIDPRALARPGQEEPALSTMSWRLVQQTAALLGLQLQRQDAPGHTALHLEFPDTLPPRLEPEGTTRFEESVVPTLSPPPLAGRCVLVLTGRREVRNVVREALRPMGLMVDFVGSVEEVEQQCQEAMPHAVVYEASLGGQRFDRLRDSLLRQAPHLAFIQIAEQGRATEVLNVSGHQVTSVGRDAIIESLPEALAFEFTRS